MRFLTITLLFFGALTLSAAANAQTFQECVSVTEIGADPHGTTEVVHITFADHIAKTANVKFFNVHNLDLNDGAWQLVASGRSPSNSIAVQVDTVLETDDFTTANLTEVSSGKLLGFLTLEQNQGAGTITFTLPNNSVVAYNLECK